MAGSLYGFGQNTYGLLDFPYKASPVQTVTFATTWSSVACGERHTAAVKTDGTLWLWGANNFGGLGDNTQYTKQSPVQTVSDGTTWSKVACGYMYTAAIKTDNTLWCWGLNNEGQLGDNTIVRKSSPVQTVAGGTNWSQVACGSRYTAAIKTDNTLWTWGYNSYGGLGDNTTVHKSSPVQTVAGGTTWSSVSCGYRHTAAIKTDNTLWTWGRNSFGQLGDNTIEHRSSPVQTVAGGTNWNKVACGLNHTAAIKTDGTLWCWGINSYGRLGDNTITNRSSPVQTVTGGTTWSQVAGGRNHTAAIKSDNTLWTWGFNSYGRLGDNTTVSKSSPIQTIAFGTNWTSTSGGGLFVAALKKDGTLWLWGHNYYGQLGDNKAFYSTAKNLYTGAPYNKFSTHFFQTAAIKTDNTLWTWGFNSYGQLGDNTTVHRSSPVQTVTGGTTWSSVACGQYYTAAIKSDNTLWVWGRNSYGNLGDNTTTHRSSPVQTVAGGTTWSQVAGGRNHTAAIKSDNTLWTWGLGSTGQLGDNTIVNKSSPVQTVAGGTTWSSVSCGYRHTAAIKTDNTLWTWGRNSYGQLGDGTNQDRSSPVQTVTFATTWSSVACGQNHTAAIKTDGTLWCWGLNSYGRLGDGGTTTRLSPVQTVAGGTNWSSVACGYFHTAAIKTDNTLWAWGRNAYGQLGDNTQVDKTSPVFIAQSKTAWSTVSVAKTNMVALLTNKLLINTQPLLGYNASPILAQPKINFADYDGNILSEATDSVTVAVQSGNATLSGTTTVTAVSGLATFTDLVLTGTGTVVLRFTSTVATQADSNSFTVSLTLPIIPKRSELSGKLPTSGQLNIGELAINIQDKKGYVKQSDGTILNIFNGELADGGTF